MEANNHWGIAIMKSNLSIFADNFHGIGNLGHQVSGGALLIAEEIGDIYSKAWAYTLHGFSCYYKEYLK